jgi:aryl-alcohol dehydrogenase-like predicted oxidoreductase
LMQGRMVEQIPDTVRGSLSGLTSNAQRAIQFTRSTPGIASALVGMSKREHVMENLGVARVPPLTREEYQRLYR